MVQSKGKGGVTVLSVPLTLDHGGSHKHKSFMRVLRPSPEQLVQQQGRQLKDLAAIRNLDSTPEHGQPHARCGD